mmetsp:Transcript_6203/g.10389  ORF Transcript_6203/g.10389 Transcript_6203/m.10389 type:complete len:216 (+) Transcript_6203:106-753(+)
MEVSSASKLEGESYSAATPWSMTSTLSESMMVLSRCATVRQVACANSVRMACWITASVSTSTAAVASSMIMIFARDSSARAMQSNCRCPTEKLDPFSVTLSSKEVMESESSVRCNPSQTSWSEYLWKGSRLDRIVPENNTGSCGITAITDRSVFRPMVAIFTPSIRISPLSNSTKRSNAVNNDDFPAPVRPTMPTFSLPPMDSVRPRKTSGSPSR